MKKEILSNFLGKYNLSKTLRFELIPQGDFNTKKSFQDFIISDKKRAEDYLIVKGLIDDVHKSYIADALSNISLNWETLGNILSQSYTAETKKKWEQELEKEQTSLRKEIVKALTADKEKYSKLTTPKECLTKLVSNLVESRKEEEEYTVNKEAVDSFKKFSSYFTGFFENRKNMYSAEPQGTAIANRLVNENFKKFVDNVKKFQKIKDLKNYTEIEKTIIDTVDSFNTPSDIKEFFSFQGYNKILTQRSIELYNSILGGKTMPDGTKKQGLNELTNLYLQQNKECKIKKADLKMDTLFKMILSDREKISWLPEAFDNDTELLDAVKNFHKDIFESNSNNEGTLPEKIDSFLESIKSSEYNFETIFIPSTYLSELSTNLFGGSKYNIIETQIIEKEKVKVKKGEEPKVKQKYYSLSYLEDIYKQICKTQEETSFTTITEYICNLKNRAEQNNLIEQVKNGFLELDLTLKSEGVDDISLKGNDTTKVEPLKKYLDSVNNLLYFFKILNINDEKNKLNILEEKDESFYASFNEIYDTLKNIIPLYNKVRNYVTSKENVEQKIKMTFNKPTLLAGWDRNKETSNASVILLKDNLYYLAIMSGNPLNHFEDKNLKDYVSISPENCYQKVDYKLLPGVNKMLPKVFLSKSKRASGSIPSSILEGYDKGIHKKDTTKKDDSKIEAFNLEFCHTLIDYFKKEISIHHDWKNFDFKFSPTESYNDISGFYREVESQGYKISYRNVKTEYIDALVKEGKIFLFQIYNKDFAEGAKGKPNMHTLYWKELFSEANLKNVVIKLNGEAELFYRQKNNAKPYMHRKGSFVLAKNTTDNKTIPGDIYKELLGYINDNSKDLSNEAKEYLPVINKKQLRFDITKDRRFHQDKYMFHVPITLNFKAQGNDLDNREVNKVLQKNHKEVYTIGIDRGERHLLYIVVVDPEGKLVYQKSFNQIEQKVGEDKTMSVDYHQKLDTKEKNRDNSRKSWKGIESIKELKAGYLSAVVHEVCSLMVKYNAIVVLEDLNFGFKRGRFKVEKQVYQKFEKALIEKLNYLVFKDKEVTEEGGALKGYQLTNKFESFQKMGKQTGFIFYVPAAYTSKIDPTTGFINLLSLKYENLELSREFFSKFDKICFNKKENYFEFHFDYDNFKTNQTSHIKKWVACSVVDESYEYNQTTKKIEKFNITERLTKLFEKNNIALKEGNCLKKEIAQINEKEFFLTLYKCLFFMLNMRQSESGTENDFMVSPIKQSNGEFFDSRNLKGKALPQDSDANGAYHIALKGRYLLDYPIKDFKESENKKETKKEDILNLKITHADWFKYRQQE